MRGLFGLLLYSRCYGIVLMCHNVKYMASWRFEIYNLVFHYLKGRTNLGWTFSLSIVTQDSNGEILEFKSVLTK